MKVQMSLMRQTIVAGKHGIKRHSKKDDKQVTSVRIEESKSVIH